jgi:hypothetical protein
MPPIGSKRSVTAVAGTFLSVLIRIAIYAFVILGIAGLLLFVIRQIF